MVPYGYIVFKVAQRLGEIFQEEQVDKKVKTFLALRVSVLRSWWSCLRKHCDYYKTYLAYGPAELTHAGYHSAEQLALEHLVKCTVRDERDCAKCQSWAHRLRGEVWEVLMASPERTEEAEKQYGFHPTAN